MMGRVTWKAPDIERPEGPLAGPERPVLQAFLDWQRATLLYKCAGLTGEQLADRAVPPSGLSLLGLVRHLTHVERVWFRQRFAGEPVEHAFGGDTEADFGRADPGRAAADYARLTEEFKLCDAAAANASLDDTFVHRDQVMSLRAIYLHMIEEYARHNGHADLLRERIDGTTGELPGRRGEQHLGRGPGKRGEDAVVDPAELEGLERCQPGTGGAVGWVTPSRSVKNGFVKIFISFDMEGVAGIADWSQCRGPGQAYEEGRRLLLGEVNAAIDGALAGGATQIVCNDSHGTMFNLDPAALHGQASYVSGRHKPLYMMQGLDAGADLVFMVGYHGSISGEITYITRVSEGRLRRGSRRGAGRLVAAPLGDRRVEVERGDHVPLGQLGRPVPRRDPPHDLELDAVRVLGVQGLRHAVIALAHQRPGLDQPGPGLDQVLERADLPGQVVQADLRLPGRLPRPDLEQAEVVVVDRIRGAQERGPAGDLQADLETEGLPVELHGPVQAVDVQHGMVETTDGHGGPSPLSEAGRAAGGGARGTGAAATHRASARRRRGRRWRRR
jgi:uncharacterized damage-inducible protein DinB